MDETHSRRTVLKTGAALGSIAAVGSLSGCSSLLGGGITYTDWLYEPGAVGDSDHYQFAFRSDEDIRSNENALDDETYGELTPSEESGEWELWDEMGIDYDDVNTTIVAQSETIFIGDFDGQDVIDELEDNGFEEEAEYEGYRLFATGSEPSSNGDLRSISCGETISSEISDNDPDGDRGNYEPITFDGTRGQTVTISMASGHGDTYLKLYDPQGALVAQDDDGGSGLNSELTYTLNETGEYSIHATSYFDSATFPYQLSLSCDSEPNEFEERQVIGIDNGVVVSASASESDTPREAVETLIDTEAGDEDRYVDESDDMAVLTDELGSGTVVGGYTQDETDETDIESAELEGAVAWGTSVTTDGETTEMRIVVVFNSSDDVDAGDIEESVESDDSDIAEDIDDFSISESGRAVVVTGDADTAEFWGDDEDSSSATAPNPTFDSDYDSADQEIEIIVTGGDVFDADDVSVDGYKVADNYDASLDSSVYFGQNQRVSAGDRFTIELDAGGDSDTDDFDLQLVWEADGGDTSATIFDTQGPDAT